MSTNTSYLNKGPMIADSIVSKIKLVIGGLFGFFFLFAIIASIVEYSSMDRSDLLIAVIFFIPFALLFNSGLRQGRRPRLARRYDQIFSSDRNGFVSLKELCDQTGKESGKVQSELEKLFRRGYFSGVNLRQGENPGVFIADARIGEEGIGFVDVKCEYCGATSRLRAGSKGKCSYCGAPMEGR